MEVDEDEPIIKRPYAKNHNPMTMIADKVELKNRLGGNTDETVHDRLGSPLAFNEQNSPDNRNSPSVHDRLGGSSIHDRLGKRNNDVDARHEIQHSRNKNTNNRPLKNRHGYEDKDGIYHDIYRADHVKDEECDNKDSIEQHQNEKEVNDRESSRSRSKHHSERYERASNDRNLNRTSSNTVKSRLGTTREETTTVPDLRDKLRKQGRGRNHEEVHEEPDVKEEEDAKVNLCIEIKQEPRTTPDEDIDMESDGNFEF